MCLVWPMCCNHFTVERVLFLWSLKVLLKHVSVLEKNATHGRTDGHTNEAPLKLHKTRVINLI